MINILPDDKKKELRAAHSNVTLTRYLLVLLGSAGFLILMSFVVYAVLDDTKRSAEQVIAINEQGDSPYASVLTRANSLRSELSNAKSILDSEVRYSKILSSIAKLMPSGTIIDSITLSDKILTTSTTLTVYARDTDTAIKLRSNFEESPVFTSVSFQGINTSSSLAGYNVSATVNVSISKGAGQ